MLNLVDTWSQAAGNADGIDRTLGKGHLKIASSFSKSQDLNTALMQTVSIFQGKSLHGLLVVQI